MWKPTSIWSRRARPEQDTPVRPFTYMHRPPPGKFRSPVNEPVGAVAWDEGMPTGDVLASNGFATVSEAGFEPMPVESPPAVLPPILSLPSASAGGDGRSGGHGNSPA